MLPAPFAPVGGWGDIAVRLLAIPLVLLMSRGAGELPGRAILLRNVLGIANQVAAVTLGATSSPGPLQLFHTGPNPAIMASLTWALISCFLSALFYLCPPGHFHRLRVLTQHYRSEHRHLLRMATANS